MICFISLSPIHAAGAQETPVKETHVEETPAQEPPAQESLVGGTFYILKHVVSWEYKYSDDFFRQPSDQYNHDLARLSFGLASSAFRDKEHYERFGTDLFKTAVFCCGTVFLLEFFL